MAAILYLSAKKAWSEGMSEAYETLLKYLCHFDAYSARVTALTSC